MLSCMSPSDTMNDSTSDDSTPTQPALLAAWLEALPEPHIVFDHDYRIVAANSAYRRQFGHGAQVVGRTCHAVSHHSPVPCDQAGETCPLARARLSGQGERVLDPQHTPAGEEYVQMIFDLVQSKSHRPCILNIQGLNYVSKFLLRSLFLCSA